MSFYYKFSSHSLRDKSGEIFYAQSMRNDEDIPTHEIEHAAAIAAMVVKEFGEVYWPIFERLEREIEQRQSRQNRLNARLKQFQ